MRPILILVAIGAVASAPLHAQRDDGVGIGSLGPREELLRAPGVRDGQLATVRPTERSDMHAWIAVGAGIGALAGATYAIVSVVRASHDDGSISIALSPVFVALGTVAGAFAGGAVGGLAYAIAHPRNIRYVT